jgi:hypothetical protein
MYRDSPIVLTDFFTISFMTKFVVSRMAMEELLEVFLHGNVTKEDFEKFFKSKSNDQNADAFNILYHDTTSCTFSVMSVYIFSAGNSVGSLNS